VSEAALPEADVAEIAAHAGFASSVTSRLEQGEGELVALGRHSTRALSTIYSQRHASEAQWRPDRTGPIDATAHLRQPAERRHGVTG